LVDDSNLKQYMYLKFGYYNRLYFSHNSISEMIKIPIADCIRFYQQSLLILKNLINKKIMQASLYDFNEKVLNLKKIN
jgi:hypothetical protein